MTPMRKKMIRELEVQRKADNTIGAYVTAVADLAQYYHRSPEKISRDEVRDYLHHLLTERRLADGTCNVKIAAIGFFYREVLGQSSFRLKVPSKRPGKLPEPFSREEVTRLLRRQKPETSRLVDGGLFDGIARLGVGSLEAHSHSLRADARSRRPGERQQGPLHLAVRTSSRRTAKLLESLPAGRVAFSSE